MKKKQYNEFNLGPSESFNDGSMGLTSYGKQCMRLRDQRAYEKEQELLKELQEMESEDIFDPEGEQ